TACGLLNLMDGPFFRTGLNLVLAARKALDMDHLTNAPAPWGSLDRNDEVDSFPDDFTHRLLARLGSELLEPSQCGNGAVGVNRGDAAGMTSVPGLKQGQSGAVTNLANDDPVGTQAHRGFQEPGHIHLIRCVK